MSADEAKQAATNAAKEAAEAKTTITEVKAWQVKKDEADLKNQEALDRLIANQQASKRASSVAGSVKSFESRTRGTVGTERYKAVPD
jgi:hypothetical protein